MPETELDRLERNINTLVGSVTALTLDVKSVTADVRALAAESSAARTDITKLHDAVKLLSTDVAEHGVSLHRIELEAAKEEGRKQVMGDLQTKLTQHDEAAREVKSLRTAVTAQEDTLVKLKETYFLQKGALLVMGFIVPVIMTLLTAWGAKLLGLS